MVSDDTPIIVGVGQFVERLDSPSYVGLSPSDIAAKACEAALAQAGGISRDTINVVGAVRTFEDTMPSPAPFGKPANYPRAVARRIGIAPEMAILETSGGQSPMTIIMDLAERLRSGKSAAALAFGSEAISTVRHLSAKGETRDWAEADDGQIEDHGRGLEGIITNYGRLHGIVGGPAAYALCENARRARLGLTREAYAVEMAKLFAPFSQVAASNPYSAATGPALSPAEIAAVSELNRMISEPYRLKMVSRDQVNLGAAVLITTVGEARKAGIDEDSWIFVHGAALAQEPDLLSRADPGAYPSAELALHEALRQSGKIVDQIDAFDFYSCFPTAVFAAAVDCLGLSADDPRRLTVTGGLPFFGGPGNNYSMHAIATMGERLRRQPGSFGLVGLNGGMQTKYGALVLSTVPAEWPGLERDKLQQLRDEMPKPKVVRRADGWGRVLTYTVTHHRGEPVLAIVIGELENGDRFVANNASPDVLSQTVAEDPLGRRIFVTARNEGNRFAFDRETIVALYPKVRPRIRDRYEHILVRRDGHLLEVTINRPDARNSLPIAAHHEMSEVFDAFEADPELWVAILTGAGDKAFCAGADLKTAGKGDRTMPLGGFAGLTSRSATKPVIAAVNGFAFGGGFETALACELVVADPDATFALSEVRVGMVAGAGGIVRLPRQIPRKIASELLLTGNRIDVATAARHGFVNRISEPGKVMECARELAAEILSVSPTSVRLTLQVLHEADSFANPGEGARAVIYSTAVDSLMISEDMEEGIAAFAQKRPPRWKNR